MLAPRKRNGTSVRNTSLNAKNGPLYVDFHTLCSSYLWSASIELTSSSKTVMTLAQSMTMGPVTAYFTGSISSRASICGSTSCSTRRLQWKNGTYMPLCLRTAAWRSTSQRIRSMLQGTSIRKWERQRGGGWRSEVLEQLRSEYYALEEGVEALDPDVADNVVNY